MGNYATSSNDMKTQLDDSHLEKIKTLTLWTSSIEVTELKGGLTNSNYLVNDDGRRYVARISKEQPLLGINRDNELLCTKTAYECGVSPRLVYSEPGIMVTEFIEGQVLHPEDVHKEESIERIARVLSTIHSMGPRLTGGDAVLLALSGGQDLCPEGTEARRTDASGH